MPSLRQGWAAGEFAQGGVAYILEVGDADLAGVEAVACEPAEESEEGYALAERMILLGVFAESDEVEDGFSLFRSALQIWTGVAVGAETIEPIQTAAEFQLIVFVFAGE